MCRERTMNEKCGSAPVVTHRRQAHTHKSERDKSATIKPKQQNEEMRNK